MSMQLELYNKQCYDLIASMIIKSEILATITESIVGKYEHNPSWYLKDKHDWRYYKNLNGEYHTLDTMMTVVSLDTLSEIEFTTDNLKLHPNTKEAYQYGTTYYTNLVKRYPNQQHLINSILNPISKSISINADDFKILYYNPKLVESQEHNLIECLQTYINKEVSMWGNRDYLTPSGYYGYVYTWQLFQQLIPRVKIIRLDNVNTNWAHSFHIWNYLDSHCGLGEYREILTHKQAMYLYRNIVRIQNNAGKNSVFKELVDIFLSDRNIPIYQYFAKHNLSTIPNTLTPGVDMLRTEINYPVLLSDGSNIETIPEVMEKEIPLGLNGGKTITDDTKQTVSEFTYSKNANVGTRVLESELVDHNFIYDYTLSDWLLNEWIVRAHSGHYDTTVVIENPNSSASYPLSVKEALILYFYTYLKSIGHTLEYLPIINTTINLSTQIPTLTELKRTIPNHTLNAWVPTLMLEDIPTIGYMKTTEEFYKKTQAIYHRWRTHLHQYKILPTRLQQSIGEVALANIYSSYKVSLGNVNERISDWLGKYNIDLSGSSAYDYKVLSDSIFMSVTGSDKNSGISRSEIHKAMLSIVTQLSGYNLQIIQVPPQDTTYSLARKALKFSNPKIKTAINQLYLPMGIKFNTVNAITPPFLKGGLHLPLNPPIGNKGLTIKNKVTPIGKVPLIYQYGLTNTTKVKSLYYPMGIELKNITIKSTAKVATKVEIDRLGDVFRGTETVLRGIVTYDNGTTDDQIVWIVNDFPPLPNSHWTPNVEGNIKLTAKSIVTPSVSSSIIVTILPPPPVIIRLDITEPQRKSTVSIDIDAVQDKVSTIIKSMNID